jgi:hypothetical protein
MIQVATGISRQKSKNLMSLLLKNSWMFSVAILGFQFSGSLWASDQPALLPQEEEVMGLEIIEQAPSANARGRGRLLPYSQLDQAGRKGTMGWVCEGPDHQAYFWMPADISDLSRYRILGFIRCMTHRDYKRLNPRDQF